MSRFFCPSANFKTPVISITTSEEIHHIKNVLRLKKGDVLHIFNGRGEEAAGKIHSLSNNAVDVKIEYKIPAMHTKTTRVILACAVPKKAKFETIIEKCTELGIDQIFPIQTKRTEVKIKADQIPQKLKRYQSIVINAAKQSHRRELPIINAPLKFEHFLTQLHPDSTSLIACLQKGQKPLLSVLEKLPTPKTINFLIGPEGDFTLEEVASAQKAGCIPVSLGPTVLKVDTAAITVTACANLLFNR